MKLFLSTMVLAAGGGTSLWLAGGEPGYGDPQKPSSTCTQAKVATAPAAPSAQAAHCASSASAPAKAVSPLAAAPAQGVATAAPALFATQASAAAPAQASSCSKPSAQGAAGDVAHDPVQRALAERAALLERLASPAATAAAPQAEACQGAAAKELAQAVTARVLEEQLARKAEQAATAQGGVRAVEIARYSDPALAAVKGAGGDVENVQAVEEALARLHGRLAGVQAAKAKVTENPLESARISGAVLADLTARLNSLHGAVAGVGVGPASGVQDPEDYEEIVRRAQEQAEREIQRAMAEAQRAIEQAQRAAERAREQAERELQRAREGAERSVQRAREQAERSRAHQRELVEQAHARTGGRSDGALLRLRELGYASVGSTQNPRAEPKSRRERTLEERVAELERRLGLGGGHTPMPHAVPQAPEAPHPPMVPHPPKAPKAPRAPHGLMPPHAPEAPAVPHEGKGGKLEKAKAKQGRFENVQVFEGIKAGKGDGEGWTVLKPSKFGGQGLKVFKSGDGDGHGVKVWKSGEDGQDFEPVEFGEFDVEVVGEDSPHGWKVDDHYKVKGSFKLEEGQHGDHGAPKGVKVWSWDGHQMRSFGDTQVMKLGKDGVSGFKFELRHDGDDEHTEECDEEACCSEDSEESECCEEDEDGEDEGDDEGDDEDGDEDMDDEDEGDADDDGMGVALLRGSSVGRFLSGLGVSPKVQAPVTLLPSALALPRSPVAADAEQLDELRELVSGMRSEVEGLRAALRELREAVRQRTADELR